MDKGQVVRPAYRTLGTMLISIGSYDVASGHIISGVAKILIGFFIYYIKDLSESKALAKVLEQLVK